MIPHALVRSVAGARSRMVEGRTLTLSKFGCYLALVKLNLLRLYSRSLSLRLQPQFHSFKAHSEATGLESPFSASTSRFTSTSTQGQYCNKSLLLPRQANYMRSIQETRVCELVVYYLECILVCLVSVDLIACYDDPSFMGT